MDDPAPESTERTNGSDRRRQRIAVVLLVLAVVTLLLAVVAGWARTQLLDTDTWVETSRDSLAEPEVATAVSRYAVDQLFAYADPEQLVREAAPPRLEPLVGPATGALREGAYTTAERAVASDQVSEVWTDANRVAHERFVTIVEGNGEIVRDTPEGIRLDVRPVLEAIAIRLGLSGERVARIPDSVALVEPRNSTRLERGIEVLRTLDRVAPLLAVLAFGLFIGAIWAAPDGSRRRLVLGWGVSIAVAGVLLGILRSAAAAPVAESISVQPGIQDAIVAVYGNVTELLRLAANAMVLIGVVTILGTWLIGPARAATTARTYLAPQLRRHPVAAWITFGVIVWIGFTQVPALESRQPLGTLLLVTLLAIGFALLRRTLLTQVPGGRSRHRFARRSASFAQAARRIRRPRLGRQRRT